MRGATSCYNKTHLGLKAYLEWARGSSKTHFGGIKKKNQGSIETKTCCRFYEFKNLHSIVLLFDANGELDLFELHFRWWSENFELVFNNMDFIQILKKTVQIVSTQNYDSQWRLRARFDLCIKAACIMYIKYVQWVLGIIQIGPILLHFASNDDWLSQFRLSIKFCKTFKVPNYEF